MKKQLDVIRKMRKVFLDLVNGLSIEQLNKIPAGFNNNIAWNFAHIVVAQQFLCYKMEGVKMPMAEKYLLKYGRNSKPDAFIDSEEIEIMKGYLTSLIDVLETDLKSDIFKNYQPYTTFYGIELNNVQDAVSMVVSHDAVHLGSAMAIKKLV